MSDGAPPPPAPAPRPPNPVVQVGWKMSAAFALLLGSLLLAGLLLPGDWRAEAVRTVAAPADSVYALLAAPARWDEWTPWPEIAFSESGPPSGPGATRSWDSPDVGAGSLTITEAEPPRELAYRVTLADGGPVTHGRFSLEPEPAGTRVTWREEGELGRNPVLGWAALAMRRRHGEELARRLEGLGEVLEARRAR